MAAESCLGAPVLALEVESVDISDDSSIGSSEAELLVPIDEDFLDSPKRKYQLDKLGILLYYCIFYLQPCMSRYSVHVSMGEHVFCSEHC